MSLVTRCPSCATTFKVVRDQLRISDGWVRCGRCSQVFDATIDLQEARDPDSDRPVEPTPDGHQGTAPDQERPIEDESGQSAGEPEAVDRTDVSQSPQDAPPSVAEDLADDPSRLAAPDASARNAVIDEASWAVWDLPLPAPVEHVVPPYRSLPPFPTIDLNLPASAPVGFRTPATVKPIATPTATSNEISASQIENADDVPLQKALRRSRVKSAKIERARQKANGKAIGKADGKTNGKTNEKGSAKSTERAKLAERELTPGVSLASESDLWAEPSKWGGAADAPAFTRRGTGRRLLVAVGLVAIALLVLQVVHQERDAIVARQPSLRPLLSALCDVTGCEISALRRIADITIDGASFSREKSTDAYRLRFRMRSAATIPLAMPSVELTLLDTRERAVVRRVLTPVEFGGPSVLPARGEREATLLLTLSGPEVAALPPVAGYRVEAFYP